MENSVICITKEGGFKCVTLSLCILLLPEDKTTETCVTTISQTFRERREILKEWKEITACMYHNQPDLLAAIPLPLELTLAKLNKDLLLMTDTCLAALKICRLFTKQN